MALRNIVRLVHMATPIKDLKGKKVLVTGAASGIGRATANLLAAHGAELVLTDINAEQLEAATRHVTALGANVIASRAFDVSDYDAVRAFAEEVPASAGALDIVMNVAGIAVWGTVENLTHEQWRRTVDINLMGPIHVIEEFVPPMIAAGRGGQLVNVSSTAGLIALPWHAAYSAAKFGLVGVSEVLRYDLRRHGIGVSVVVPGAVETGLIGFLPLYGLRRGLDTGAGGVELQAVVHAAHAIALAPALRQGGAAMAAAVFEGNHPVRRVAPENDGNAADCPGKEAIHGYFVVPCRDIPAVLDEHHHLRIQCWRASALIGEW